jgi:hypothetical protein
MGDMTPEDFHKNCRHLESFLSVPRADELFYEICKEPWKNGVLEYSSDSVGSKRSVPFSVHDNVISRFKAEADVQDAIKSIRCLSFRFDDPKHYIDPQKNPALVAVLVLGQGREIQVGGSVKPPKPAPESQWEIAWHEPATSFLLRHGSLLVINGENILYSVPKGTKEMNHPIYGRHIGLWFQK